MVLIRIRKFSLIGDFNTDANSFGDRGYHFLEFKLNYKDTIANYKIHNLNYES